MGLKSVLGLITWPFRFLWKHKNRFLSENKIEKQVVINEDSKKVSSRAPAISIKHEKVDFNLNVPHENPFYLNNGKVLNNLNELSNELISMDSDTFHHHVNDQKNDFSNWIKDVIHSPELAIELSATHDIYSTREILEKHRV
ncbi:MAG: hypothetical protein AABX51_07970 [Nanoarchaeota archaeon]